MELIQPPLGVAVATAPEYRFEPTVSDATCD
jgi:hypothetical protein